MLRCKGKNYEISIKFRACENRCFGQSCLNFLTLKEEFSSTNIDTSTIDDQHQIDKMDQKISAKTTNLILHPTTFDYKNLQELKQLDLDEMAEGEFEVIQLKDNFLPTGLTPLEDIFDSNDMSMCL